MRYPCMLIKLIVVSEPYFRVIDGEITALQNIAIPYKTKTNIEYAIASHKTLDVGSVIMHEESIMSPVEDMRGVYKRWS